MKTLIILLIFLFVVYNNLFSQSVGINSTGSSPDASAMLEIKAEGKGLLIPRIALTGVNDATTITSPATSLLVYNTATVSGIAPGFYYNSGTASSPVWTRLISAQPDWNVTGGDGQILNKPTTVSGYGITDAMTTSHAANGITSSNIINWNTAFGWGNHSGLYRPSSYLPAWSEITSNPFSFSSSLDNQLLKYNSSTSKWENWTPNFITGYTETDPVWTAVSANYYTKTNMQTSGSAQLHFNNLTNKPTSASGYGISDAVTTTGNQSITGTKTFSVIQMNSTTTGFLPPRMTRTQMLDISSPEEGSVVYNTTDKILLFFNGTEWCKPDGSIFLYSGKPYLGGLVAYIFQKEDAGYVTGETHGLLASPYDISGGVTWGSEDGFIGATSLSIGSGAGNTRMIVDALGTGNYAAYLCDTLTLNGYTDWYLPAREELNKLYNNNVEIVSGVTEGRYWSSTESNRSFAYNIYFMSFPNENSTLKSYSRRVRAFRTF